MLNVELVSQRSDEVVVLEFNAFTFAGGEQHIRFKPSHFVPDSIKVFTRLNNSDDILQLLMAIDALKAQFANVPLYLTAPYLPYARQDRRCYPGEAFGLKVMAELLNALNCAQITLFDVHSPVAFEHINNLVSISAVDIITNQSKLTNLLRSEQLVAVAPDKGAQGIVLALVERLGLRQYVLGNKTRAAVNGEVLEVAFSGDVLGKNLLIVDDICDGGRTFIEAAKALKSMGAKSVSLYITHGIFSAGLAPFVGLVEHIYTTNTICEQYSLTLPQGVTLEVFDVTHMA